MKYFMLILATIILITITAVIIMFNIKSEVPSIHEVEEVSAKKIVASISLPGSASEYYGSKYIRKGNDIYLTSYVTLVDGPTIRFEKKDLISYSISTGCKFALKGDFNNIEHIYSKHDDIETLVWSRDAKN
jgi:hypothetical protein